MKNAICFSIKYDLGLLINDVEAIKARLSNHYKVVELKRNLAVFNLSYLSTKTPDFELIPIREVEGGKYIRSISLSQGGIISFWIERRFSDKGSPADLLKEYERFVSEKNKFYLPYLNENGRLTGSLIDYKDSLTGEVDSLAIEFDFAEDVRLIREACKASDKDEYRYDFHDYRTLFFLSDKFMKKEAEISRLCDLDKGAVNRISKYQKEEINGGHGYMNTWSHVLSADLLENSQFRTLFEIAHSNWFKAQTWVYFLREVIDAGGHRKMSINDLHEVKNQIGSEMFSMKNVDLVLKSSSYNRLLNSLLENFKIKSQFDLIELELLNLENYIEKENDAFQREVQKKNEKHARMLEVLFVISAISAIASYPMFLAGSTSKIDAANPIRAVSLFLLFGSTIFFVILKIIKRRHR